MAARRGKLRRLVHQERSSIWPSVLTSWSEIPGRLRQGAPQISRLTVAAVIAYLVAHAVSPGTVDLTAPLTALLVVQASTVGTLRVGLVRVGAVLTGVLVSVALASYVGLSWWSLGAAVAAALILATVLRLGEQSLEAPISAMLILAVSSPELAAQVRVVNTLLGTAIGIGFSFLVPVSIPNARASDAVRRVARSQAALLDEVALTLGDRAPQSEEVKAWLDWTADIAGDIDQASAAVQALADSRRFNHRALTAAKVHPGLRSALDRLDGCLAAERALLVVIANESPPDPAGAQNESGPELGHAIAVVLDDLATGLRAFGDVVSAEYGVPGKVYRADEAVARTLEAVRETRAVLAELMTLDVDPRERTDLWLLQGPMLAAVDEILRQLDWERTGPPAQWWLTRYGPPRLPENWLPVSRPGRVRKPDNANRATPDGGAASRNTPDMP
jgi:hypothetical protein